MWPVKPVSGRGGGPVVIFVEWEGMVVRKAVEVIFRDDMKLA